MNGTTQTELDKKVSDLDKQPNLTEQAVPGAAQTPATNDARPSRFTRAEDEQPWQSILTLPAAFPAHIFEGVMLNLIRNPNITSSHLFRADILFEHQLYDNRDARHLKAEYRPQPVSVDGWDVQRTIVRELIPRNTRLDRPLVQTCHFLTRGNEMLVLYVPHAKSPEDIPFYHPKVAELSFKHGETLELSYRLFPGCQLDERLQRTGLRLLETIDKHGRGQLAGYEKRVHHDTIITQKTYQDTYTRLKNKYGRHLVDNWQEVTDPGKHVFEDIAIAAFLIELWKTIDFTSFVDIGCGNGILTYLLTSEGYKGYGFDARQRKTWSLFPEHVKEHLLIPSVLNGNERDFEPGTFIISNHADELTAWTPLLAYLNDGSFIAIPCCSHDLSGARFRAPGRAQATLPPGSLSKSLVHKKMASAYSSLCSYVEYLATEVGFEAETEVLRIPSTRNHSIIGRKCAPSADRQAVVRTLLEKELGRSVDTIAAEWTEKIEKLARKPPSGH